MNNMKTLIEMYDERPIENVLATEVFKPQKTVFLCPPSLAQSKAAQKKLEEYFRHRGVDTSLEFLESSRYNTAKLLRQLANVVQANPDCVIDITGGTDAALFACGKLCAETDTPAFTYSRRRNCFYNIHNAPFAEELECRVQHEVEDCFLMAGGAVRMGRVDNSVLGRYMDKIVPFFELYMKHRGEWTRIVNYIQRASQQERGLVPELKVNAPYCVKGERGSRICAPDAALADFEALGFIRDLSISSERVSFEFADRQIRTWLRDIGSVLELYVYKACLDTGAFNDVRTSVIVDWEGDNQRDDVTNEIDVMAMRGIVPVFISCKTCEISTEALNELAILRDRFGGKIARAVIVTTKRCRTVTRHRASELNIAVIDLEDIKTGHVKKNIQAVLKDG